MLPQLDITEEQDRPSLRQIPGWESDDFFASTAQLAAVLFEAAGWKWHGKTDPPGAALIALVIRRHGALVKQHLNDGDYDYQASGTGRIEVRHSGGFLRVMVELGSLNLIDWAELERRETEDKSVGRAAIAEMRASITTTTP